MEWFGLSSYGVSDTFKDMLRDDYVEPKEPENLLQVIKNNPDVNFTDLVKEVDCYIGIADGYAYSSVDRLQRMRHKGIFKPVGPVDMYKYPGAQSMKYGWSKDDPALANETWYLPRIKQNKPTTEITRFLDFALRIDKFFKL